MVLKTRKLIVCLIALVIIVGIAVFANSFQVVDAEVATGAAIDGNEYWVTAGAGGENRISCSKEQYDEYTDNADFGGTDALFVVIYERKPLIPSQKKVIQVKKFKDDWDDALHMSQM